MKISRNSQCPCGSGRKYKVCHINKKDIGNVDSKNISGVLNKLSKKSKVYMCLHPDKEKCLKNIINAHSIANSRILNKLAKNGHVIMPSSMVGLDGSGLLEVKLGSIGRNNASTFRGFCGYHDSELFKEIDNKEFTSSDEQVFLFSYRAFAREYITKLEALKLQRKFFSDYPEKAIEMNFIESSIMPHAMSVNDNESDLKLFNEALLNNDYTILESMIFDLNFVVNFATSFATEIEKDLNNKRMNDIFDFSADYKPAKSFINVIPGSTKSYIVISCLKSEFAIYEDYFIQLKNLFDIDLSKFLNYMTNIIVRNSENIVIGSRLWEHFELSNVVDLFNDDWNSSLEEFIMPLLSELNLGNDLTRFRGYNLFEKLDI